MGEIYGIYSEIEDKIVYIGQTIIGYKNRFKKHIRECKYKSNKKIHKKMLKYGVENFYPILLLECENNLLNEKEKEFIKLYDTYTNGCNLTIGGETMSGYKHKEETKIIIGEKLKVRWKNDREKFIESFKKRPPRKQYKEELELRKVKMREKNPMHDGESRKKLSATCKEKYKNGYTNPNTKKWKLTMKNKEVLMVVDLKKYCIENNFKYSTIYYAFNNKKSYKDIEKIEKV